ncbi:MAG: hypothetical protein JRJ03_14395 [Deltaproteobacteria bacterium]|nr:hypothetical protein [Deltaproteobacteria bacterium]
MGDTILHILKTEPDETQKVLMERISEGRKSLEFLLFGHEKGVDYERLIDLIFDCDKVITWW